MKTIACHRRHLEERIRQRGATWEAVRPCIVKQSAEDELLVDVDHPAYPKRRVAGGGQQAAMP